MSDPFLALQRDFEAGAGDKEKKPICMNPLSILEAVMAHCRKMQERMAAQLAAAENRQKKVSCYETFLLFSFLICSFMPLFFKCTSLSKLVIMRYVKMLLFNSCIYWGANFLVMFCVHILLIL